MTRTRSYVKAAAAVVMAIMMALVLFIVPGESVSAASLNKTSVTIIKGYSTTLKVSGASSSKVKWSSSNSNVAKVSSTGKVVGKKAGSCYVYAYVGSSKLSCRVKVVAGKLSSSRSSLSMNAGDSQIVTITAKGSHSVKVSSSDKSVATARWASSEFDGNNVQLRINAVGSGTATIKVYLKGNSSIYTNIKVNVSGSSSSSATLSATSTNVSVSAGNSTTVTLTASNPANLNYAWSSTNIADYTASNQGNGKVLLTITGRNQGTTSLRISDSASGKSLTISVTVNSISWLTPTNLNLAAGKTGTLTANVNGYYVTVASSNDNVARATITNQGNNKTTITVTAVTAGTATITVTDGMTGQVQRATVTVTGSSFAVQPTNLSVAAGETKTVTITCSNVNNIILTANSNCFSYTTSYNTTTKYTLNITGKEAGTGYIYVQDTSSGETKTVTVNVTGGSFIVSPTNLTMNVGDTKTFTITASNISYVTVTDNNNFIVTSESNSGNKKTVSVYATGAGNGYIYIYDGNSGQTKTVNVTVSGGTLIVSPTQVTMKAGESRSVSITCSNTNNLSIMDNNNFITTSLSATSSTTAVVYINALRSGSGIIYIYDNTAGKNASISVKVEEDGQRALQVSTTSLYFTPTDMFKTFTVSGSSADNISIYVVNSNVAAINSNVATSSTTRTVNVVATGEGQTIIQIYDSLTGQSAQISINVVG